MELQVGVKILIKNKKGEFLLLQRNLEKYPDALDKWDTVGGRINIGEPLMDNLKREVMEETGLTLTGEPKLLIAQDIFKSDKHIVRLTYLGEARGEIKLSEEHSKYSWFTKEDLKKMPNGDRYIKEVADKDLI